MSTYYNEFDPAKAHMLRALIAEGLIAPGDVDERSIKDVKPTELYGYDQCHFFAGIGGWSLALRLAGWPDDRPVWTGSCPCQPFSDAGKGLAEADERHLWPMFFRLIRECRPGVVFGEQVASAAALRWWDGVSHDLETADYACGAVDICAASVGAPHIRQRLYWVADAGSGAGERDAGSVLEAQAGIGGAGQQHGDLPLGPEHGGASSAGGLADTERPERRAATGRGDNQQHRPKREGQAASGPGDGGTTGGLAHAGSPRANILAAQVRSRDGSAGESGTTGGLGDTSGEGLQGNRPELLQGGDKQQPAEPDSGPWSDSRIILCRDGKARRVPLEPAFFPLAPRLLGRVHLLRGAGDSIVPPLAAEFIKVHMTLVQ